MYLEVFAPEAASFRSSMRRNALLEIYREGSQAIHIVLKLADSSHLWNLAM